MNKEGAAFELPAPSILLPKINIHNNLTNSRESFTTLKRFDERFLEDSTTFISKKPILKVLIVLIERIEQWRPSCVTIGVVGSNSIPDKILTVLVYFIQELLIFTKLTKAGPVVTKGPLTSQNF